MKSFTLRKFILVILCCMLLTACGPQETGTDEPSITTSQSSIVEEPFEASTSAPDETLPDNEENPYDQFAITIKVNQVGYYPDSSKIAIFPTDTSVTEFNVVDATTNEVVYTGDLYQKSKEVDSILGDFSDVTEAGQYYILCQDTDASPIFTVHDDVYDTLTLDTVKMLYYQRCGTEIYDDTFGHKACHIAKATIYGSKHTLDVSGGWHDAGDFGRYIVPAAQTVAQLLYAYEAHPTLFGDDTGIPESGNHISDLLDEVKYELEWMMKMQDSSGGVYHKVTCSYHPAIVMPEQELAPLLITPISTTATADFCGAMALAYEIYAQVDESFAEDCLKAAKKAWNYLEQHPELIFENPSNITTGTYEDTKDTDERYWAAAQMYRATKDITYWNTLRTLPAENGLGWQTMGDYGNIALLTTPGIDITSSLYQQAYTSIISQANYYLSVIESSPYDISIDTFYWGSNMSVANGSILLIHAYQLTHDSTYLYAAEANLHYLLGRNGVDTCFVTGYGQVSPLHPHHRVSMIVGVPVKGMLAGGVNSFLQDDIVVKILATAAPDQCYFDHSASYSTNEVAIYWNSSLTYLLTLLESNYDI